MFDDLDDNPLFKPFMEEAVRIRNGFVNTLMETNSLSSAADYFVDQVKTKDPLIACSILSFIASTLAPLPIGSVVSGAIVNRLYCESPQN